MKARELADLLPSPGVRFGEDFAGRVGRLALRLAGAERREGRGRAALFGAGEEFAGHRPYRPGEDPRRLDWSLLARLDRPYVRVLRREASERWSVLLDTSASMGVGVPGKLQLAAEVTAALAAVGTRAGATVEVRTSSGHALELSGRRGSGAPGLRSLLDLLEAERARGSADLGELLQPARLRGSGRVFAVGDLFDVGPDAAARLARVGRDLAVLWVLAPDELAPEPEGAVAWVDPETGEEVRLAVDSRALADYERALSRELERWRDVAGHRGLRFAAFSTRRPFEDVARAALWT